MSGQQVIHYTARIKACDPRITFDLTDEENIYFRYVMGYLTERAADKLLKPLRRWDGPWLIYAHNTMGLFSKAITAIRCEATGEFLDYQLDSDYHRWRVSKNLKGPG